jgi:uncharacterized protein (DUF486 family)
MNTFAAIPLPLQTLLLLGSILFMTFAWLVRCTLFSLCLSRFGWP